MVNRVCILGHLGGDTEDFGGQTIKTRALFSAMKDCTDYEIASIDTYKWKRHPIRLISNIVKAVKNCDAIIMLPANKGVRIFVPLLNLINKKHKCKIFYNVIGGWLPKLLRENNRLTTQLKKIDYVLVETNIMKKSLEYLGVKNVVVMPNLKDLNVTNINKTLVYNSRGRNFCTFSRVMKEKGITDAINAVAEINKIENMDIHLDIYGLISDNYKNEFNCLLEKHQDSVSYCGRVDAFNSVEILEKYYGLLFPTKFYTEGVPGTIIDAMFAKLPVIGSKWESCDDVIDSKIGFKYDFNDINGLMDCIIKMIRLSKEEYLVLCDNCGKRAEQYLPKNVCKIITKLMGE